MCMVIIDLVSQKGVSDFVFMGDMTASTPIVEKRGTFLSPSHYDESN